MPLHRCCSPSHNAHHRQLCIQASDQPANRPQGQAVLQFALQLLISTTVCCSMSRTVFVGNLPLDTRDRELEDLFYKYGRISDIDLKLPSRPPAFAFIEYADPRDAQDAVAARDGYDFGGERIRVCFRACRNLLRPSCGP